MNLVHLATLFNFSVTDVTVAAKSSSSEFLARDTGSDRSVLKTKSGGILKTPKTICPDQLSIAERESTAIREYIIQRRKENADVPKKRKGNYGKSKWKSINNIKKRKRNPDNL